MSFADIINQEKKRLDEKQGGNSPQVEYPKTKHKRLYYEKGQRELLIQVLPSADLLSTFAEPIRKIFLQAKSSTGKDINTNFVLSPDKDYGSVLEGKIEEWSEKGMIPNGFGGQQTPRRLYLVNAVQIVQDQTGQLVQERDQEGNLVVRVFEMPQSAYANLITKLQDPMYNPAGKELSFMDINQPAPIKITKPAKGQMEYTVDVYGMVQLPPLGQGWENQLEDLKAQAVPTERLVNGMQWVQAFIDMKEGRKPNQNNEETQYPQANPYAQQQVPQQPQHNYTQNSNPSPMSHTLGQGTGGAVGGYNQQQQQQPQINPYAQQQVPQQQVPQQQVPQQQVPQQQVPQQAEGLSTGVGPIGEEIRLEDTAGDAPQQPNMGNVPPTPQMPKAPQATPQEAPKQPSQDTQLNNNGLADIDAMLEQELNGGL